MADRKPLTIGYDSDNNASKLVEVNFSSIDLADFANIEPTQGQVLAFSAGSFAPSTISQIDHGALAGLADDDHTQYVLSDGTRPMSTLFVDGALRANTVSSLSISGVALNATTASALTLHVTNLGASTIVLTAVNAPTVAATTSVSSASVSAVSLNATNASALNLTATNLHVPGNIAVTGTVDGVDIATRDGVLTSTTTTANAAMPKSGGAFTGAVTTNSTFDGVDIATRDAVLTSTTTTANNALPKAGGVMTGTLDGTTLNAITSVSSASVSAVALNATNASALNLTGTTITANDVNLSGNLTVPDYTGLANAGIATTLHREVGAPVASSNSTSLAEVASYTLPANILTQGDIDIMIRGRQLAQGSNLRFNFKIAGTNILNSSISQGTFSDFTRYTMHIQISKMATDRQMVTARFIQGTGTGSAAGFSGWSSSHRDGIIHNEATGDESGTLALSLQAQQSNSSQTVSVDHFTVKLIPNPA